MISFPFTTIPVMLIVMMSGNYLAPRLRGKTESGDPKIFWGRCVKYALVFSAVWALVFTGEFVLSEPGILEAGLGIIPIIIVVGSLFFGVVIVAAMLFPERKPIARSFQFERLRTGSMWAVFWTSFFTVPYFVIASILNSRVDSNIFPAYALLFAVAAVGGAAWGTSQLSEVKRWIDGGKVVLPGFYADQSSAVFLRGCLFFAMFAVAPLFFSRIVFGLAGDAWGASIFGFLLGASAYRFIWVRRYEKRNNVRLVYEVSDSDQPAEAAV